MHRLVVAAVVVGLCAAHAPRAHAQRDGLVVAVGLGAGVVSKLAAGQGSEPGTALYLRVGESLARAVALQLELERHRLTDGEPRVSDVSPDGTRLRDPEVFRTTYLMASIRFASPAGFYLRPGVGLGVHAFEAYEVNQAAVVNARTSTEVGRAVGVAVGYEWQGWGRLAPAVEAVARWSDGEDSTAGRRVVGVNVMAGWYF